MSDAGDVMLPVDEVAGLLHVTQEAVRRWLRSGELPGVRLGGKRTGWRVRRRDLETWIDSRSLARRRGAASADAAPGAWAGASGDGV